MDTFKKIVRKALMTAVLLALVNSAIAQGSSFSLQQAIDYAVQNNANTLNAQLDMESAQYQKREVIGIGLPQINGSVEAAHFIEKPTTLFPGEFVGRPGTYVPLQMALRNTITAGVQVTQLVFSSDYIVALSSTDILTNLAQKNYDRTRIETASEVSKAYYNVLVSRERFALMQANVERIKKLRDDTRALNQNGFVEKIDVDRIEVLYNNMLVEQQNVQRLVSLTESLLKFQMGYDINQPITLTDQLNLQDQSQFAAIDTSAKVDVTKRIEYALLESQKLLNQADLRRNKLSYLPTLAVFGNVNTQYQREEFEPVGSRWFPSAMIGGSLTVPIFSGGQRHYKTKRASIALMKTENTMKALQNGITLEATNARIAYQNAYASLLTQQKNMELAQEVYRVSKLKYEQGVGSNIEVLTAETSLKEAQTNYYSAMYNALIAKVDFEKANGTLIK
jgi:outer membrane protein TolC